MGKIGQARGFLFFRIVNKFFFPQAKKKTKMHCAGKAKQHLGRYCVAIAPITIVKQSKTQKT